MANQRTIKQKISFEGVGLHTGQNTKIELLPAVAGSGIFFVRKDISHAPMIKACIDSVLAPEQFPRRTSLGIGDVHVYTIEHLMAAFHILNIDNVIVNIWGQEVPGMDGSAKIFVDEIIKVGIEEQTLPREYLVVKEPVWLNDGAASVVILPATDTRVSYVLQYDNPVIGAGFVDLKLNGELNSDFYQARTFCLEDEVKALLDKGLGKGSSYNNTLVISKQGVVNNQLRCNDEFVKHKILDLIGDLYLLGPFRGSVLAVKSGHPLNIRLINRVRKYHNQNLIKQQTQNLLIVSKDGQLNVEEIMKILPHRYPFLLVDRVISLESGKSAVGIKNVTVNESFFQGHFPGRPVMPGVLMIEAMAQVGGIAILAASQHRGKLAYFMAVDKVKFRKTVVPGDQLRIEALVGKVRSRTGMVTAQIFVEDKLAVEAELMFALVD